MVKCQFCLMGGRLCFMSLKKHDSAIGKQLDVTGCGLVEQVTSGTVRSFHQRFTGRSLSYLSCRVISHKAVCHRQNWLQYSIMLRLSEIGESLSYMMLLSDLKQEQSTSTTRDLLQIPEAEVRLLSSYFLVQGLIKRVPEVLSDGRYSIGPI